MRRRGRRRPRVLSVSLTCIEGVESEATWPSPPRVLGCVPNLYRRSWAGCAVAGRTHLSLRLMLRRSQALSHRWTQRHEGISFILNPADQFLQQRRVEERMKKPA